MAPIRRKSPECRSDCAQSARGSAIFRLFLSIALIAGLVAIAAPPSGAAGRWAIAPSASPIGPPLGELSAVSCASTSDCFAVGDGTSGSLIEHWNGTNWKIVTSPNPPGLAEAELSGVSCTSSTNCFAVGDSSIDTETSFTVSTFVLHWNGTTWSTVASPTPTGANDVELNGVSCSSATNCFAVGSSGTAPIDLDTGTFTSVPLTEHWDGTSWSIVASPTPTDTMSAELLGVSCPSASSCVAVGDFEASAIGGALVEQWNGAAWSIVTNPDSTNAVTSRAKLRMHRNVHAAGARGLLARARPGAVVVGGGDIGGLGDFETTPGLQGVSCASVTSCFAVGASFSGALTEQFDGAKWTIVAAPTPRGSGGADLGGIACTSATECSAVGSSQVETVSGDEVDEEDGPLAEHWDGTAWSVVAEPSGAPFSDLNGIACPAASNCAAVGDSALVQHWNGTSWSMAAFGSKTSQSQFNQVSCSSATSCFAVGVSGSIDEETPLIERWNGARWSVVPSPKVTDAFETSLVSVSCPSATSCFAVGLLLGEEAEAPLIEHWNGTSWSRMASPSPGSGELDFAELTSVACPSASNCNAVGVAFSETGGSSLAEHWNGKKWTIVKTPTVNAATVLELVGLSCPTTTDCTAVGTSETGDNTRVPGARTLTEHFDGTTWSIVPSPSPSAPFSILGSVSCSGPTSCIATGFQAVAEEGPDRALTEHWNGTSWAIVPTASPAGAKSSQLISVSCRSAGSCYAVGNYTTKAVGKTLVEHWNGTAWSIVASANASGSANSELAGVSCPTPATCIAVGAYTVKNGFFTLSERGS
jgi:hypothetical protein